MNPTFSNFVEGTEGSSRQSNGDEAECPVPENDVSTPLDSVDDHLPRWVHTLRKRITELEIDGRLEELFRGAH